MLLMALLDISLGGLLVLILKVLLVLFLISLIVGAPVGVPRWGYGGTGWFGFDRLLYILVVIIVILWLLGRI